MGGCHAGRRQTGAPGSELLPGLRFAGCLGSILCAIVGIDDVRYAKLLRVPLTTLWQPCQEIGEAAIDVMLSRIARPELPARDILLDCQLIVRESCGEATHRSAA